MLSGTQFIHRYGIWFLGLLLLFGGSRALWDTDEGRYAEISREMLITGDWIIPRMEGEEHLSKPPLIYWLTAAGYRYLGTNEWGARAFSSLACIGTVLCVWGLAKIWRWSDQESTASAIIYATALLPFVSGHLLTTDVFLTFWETLGILCAWKVWTSPSRISFWRWGFWISFGLAFLTKGPPGWLPLGVIALYRLSGIQQKPTEGLFKLFPFLAFLFISFAWFILVEMQDASSLRYFLVYEVWDRLFSTIHHRNHPWWIYPPILFLGLFPWIFLWPSMLRSAWNRLRGGWRRSAPHEWFSLLWIALPLTVFTLAESRLPLYVAPLFVPLAIWAGRIFIRTAWPRLLFSGRLRTAAGCCVVIWAALLLLFMHYPDQAPYSKSHRPLARAILEREHVTGETVECYSLGGAIHHSIAFYSRRYIDEMILDSMKHDYFDYDHLQDFNLRKERMGVHPLYLLRLNRFERIAAQYPVTVLARDNTHVLFEVPDPGSASHPPIVASAK